MPHNSTFLFYYPSGVPITTTADTPRPVITLTDSTASISRNTTVYGAPISKTTEYSTSQQSDLLGNPGAPTATLTTTGIYTIQVELILLPGVTSPSNPVFTSPTTQSSTSTTSSSLASSSSASSSSASSSTTLPASKPATPGPVFHSGDIAGAAVGCLVGGALIAGILVWLIMSTRYKKQRSRAGFAQRREGSSNNNYEKPLPTGPPLGGAAGVGWEQHLPQSESDNTVRASVKALFDQIELHVENFYRNATVSINPEVQAELMKIDSSYLPDSVVGLLPQTKTPTMLIKHCLAQLIVSHITPDSETSASFLPADFVALPRAMSGAKANSDKPAFAQALSRWRVLSHYLRPRPKDDRAYLSVRDGHITLAADRFCSAFAPWATSANDRESRRRNLVEIMKSASDTGILIFSQPSGFAYRWTVPSERDRKGLIRIVVVPGFAKVTDEHARNLPGRGQELVAPVIGTL